MPKRPLKPCRAAGCRELTREQYCEKHKRLDTSPYIRKTADYRRGSATVRGYDGRWQKARKIFLQSHPLCENCKNAGKVTPATVVDHIIPHKGDAGLFWDTKNWQALCKQCHDKKTASEDGGFGNSRRG